MRSFVMLAGCFIISLRLEGQINAIPEPPEGQRFLLSYVVEETSLHSVSNDVQPESLSPLDVEKMRPLTIEKRIERRVSNDNHHSSVITMLNPEQAYSEFPVMLGRIEINQAGKQIYDTKGQLYHSMPADSAYSAHYDLMRQQLADNPVQLMLEFPAMPDGAEIQAIQAEGGMFQVLENNAWKIFKGDEQLLFEPLENKITNKRYESGVLKETYTRRFVQTNQGIYAPLEELQERQVIRPSGACMTDVVRKLYSDYSVALSSTERSKLMKSKTGTEIWPNPAVDQWTLTVGKDVLPESTILIYDLAGTLIYQQSGIQPETSFQISPAAWPDGVYMAHLSTNSGREVIKLLKKSR